MLAGRVGCRRGGRADFSVSVKVEPLLCLQKVSSDFLADSMRKSLQTWPSPVSPEEEG